MLRFCLVWFFFCLLFFNKVISTPGPDEKSVKITQCGGAIESDGDTLTYPKPGDLIQPGELCVWTIHLKTLNEFKFNFSALNISSGNGDCSNAGVRIYSLSNLIPGDKLQSYTFCDENPPTTDVFFGHNIAAVVFYTNSQNSNSGSGFTLNWEGQGIDPQRTKHLSSYSTVSSDVIRYPIRGGYEPNLAATWLVNNHDTDVNSLEIELTSISLEGCDISPEICACDALVLYEISDSGLINETGRFCGNQSDVMLGEVGRNFILGFFTDWNSNIGFEGGFDLNYYPKVESITTEKTSTTQNPITTEEPEKPVECGFILHQTNGSIKYKLYDNYLDNQRCIWIIRAENSTEIEFYLQQRGTYWSNDWIWITGLTIDKDGPGQEIENKQLVNPGDKAIVKGPVAIVTFTADPSSGSQLATGFILEFKGNDVGATNISSSSSDYLLTNTNFTNEISHPISGNYANNELSVFVLAPPQYLYGENVTLYATYDQRKLDTGSYLCGDSVAAYKFNRNYGLGAESRFCPEDSGLHGFDHDDFMVFVFRTDGGNYGDATGFALHWLWSGN